MNHSSLRFQLEFGLIWLVTLIAYIFVLSGCEEKEIVPLPTAGFTSSRSVIETGDLVSFTNKSVGAEAYLWDFGDGNTSTDESPIHTFTKAGKFAVVLKAINESGEDTAIDTIRCAVPLVYPTAQFKIQETSFFNGDSVIFTNESTNALSNSWDFGDGQSSEEVSPNHVFDNPGEYTVQLIVVNTDGADTTSMTIEILDVSSLPVAGFEVSSTEVGIGELVAFTNSSLLAKSFLWDFGDEQVSTDASPTHQYAMEGTYMVKLTVINDAGIDSIKMEMTCSIAFCPFQLCNDHLFDEFIKTENVVYGINATSQFMNVYEPKGDDRERRPVILLMSGGSFQNIDLNRLDAVATRLVKRGFVVGTMSYRVGSGPSSPGVDWLTRLINAQQDSRAAVRYMRKEAEKWKIDPDFIVLGGWSAGAIAALAHTYIDQDEVVGTPSEALINSLGGLEGAQGNPGFSSSVRGVISMAGSLFIADQLVEAGDTPLFGVHGTLDNQVAIGIHYSQDGTPNYGSKPLVEHAQKVGINADIYIFSAGGHYDPVEKSEAYIDQLMDWIESI